MSRSWKKNGYVKDGEGSGWKKKAKRYANRRVRLSENISSGGSFKKVSNSWDICDFKFELGNTKKERSK